jgi:hypothetical protein
MCDSVIKTLEDVVTGNPSEVCVSQGEFQYPNGKLGRNDESIFLQDADRQMYYDFNNYLNDAVGQYINDFAVLKNSQFRSSCIKVQKTKVGGGYMEWHCEKSSHEVSNRILVWTAYLNDLPEGEGETEFLYQHKRFRPKKGTVVIFPADFTHTHRGNPPLTTTKYIATAWYELY